MRSLWWVGSIDKYTGCVHWRSANNQPVRFRRCARLIELNHRPVSFSILTEPADKFSRVDAGQKNRVEWKNTYSVHTRNMKAMVVSPVGGRVPPSRGVLHNSLGINGTRRDLEAEEVAAYLTKLRSLVPDMPRKRKLSKLEVIQRVIEYICDLQTTLEETNVHNDSTVAKTASRQPLQPLLTRRRRPSLRQQQHRRRQR